MDRTETGAGVEGSLGSKMVATLAQLGATCGYGSFWFNVTPGEVDPIATMRSVLERSESIDIGVGVVPLDAYALSDVARGLRTISSKSGRIIFGVGSGQTRRGALRIVERGVAELRSAAPACRIAIGAAGPNMLQLAGRIADAVLLNWLTPESLAWARMQISRGANSASKPIPTAYLYHRVAQGSGATSRIRAEMAGYSVRHSDPIGITANDRGDIDRALRVYVGSCIPVLRPIPSDRRNVSEWRSLIRFFAPRTDVNSTA
jgi:alkanesulfonate monooxygenase SsuD/methylene tetrahydromethanopterin reductase-like flavin-dependent oxidoreductase (luciferase family)